MNYNQQSTNRFRLAIILPGILVAATGVGAGDLITASLAGMRVGTAILWAIPLGVLLKWVLTEGIARWHLATGTTLFDGWIQKLGRWIEWTFFVYLLLWSYVVGGALVNACGLAGHSLLPLSPDAGLSKTYWGIAHAIAGLILVRLGGFRLFEKVMSAAIAIMFATVILTAVLLQPDWGVILSGLFIPAIPSQSTEWLIGLLGGVGGTVTILIYGYWIAEKGRSGRQGLRESRIDLSVAYFLTGLFSVAMIIIVQRLRPEDVQGLQLAIALADQLGDTLGGWARWAFLVGFWGAVFSSLLGVLQGVPYLFADFVRQLGLKKDVKGDANKKLEESTAYRGYMLVLAIVPLSSLWLHFETIQLAYAVIGAFFMPVLALTLLLLNNNEAWVGETYRNGWIINILLMVTLLFFACTGGIKLFEMISAGLL